jgi:ketosteroid isomerase-like protein
MPEVISKSSSIDLLRLVYDAFNRRDFESVLALMHPDVDWPNGMEGGRVLGKAAVREYWRRQFEQVQSTVEPQSFTTEPNGRVAIAVHQVVRDLAGNRIVDRVIQHVYAIENGLIRNMEIRD